MLTAQVFIPTVLHHTTGEDVKEELLTAFIGKAAEAFQEKVRTYDAEENGYRDMMVLEVDIPSTMEAKDKFRHLAEIIKAELELGRVYTRYTACIREWV